MVQKKLSEGAKIFIIVFLLVGLLITVWGGMLLSGMTPRTERKLVFINPVPRSGNYIRCLNEQPVILDSKLLNHSLTEWGAPVVCLVRDQTGHWLMYSGEVQEHRENEYQNAAVW